MIIAEQERRQDSQQKLLEKAMQEVKDLKQTVKQMQKGKQPQKKKLIVKKQKCSAPIKTIRKRDDRDSNDQFSPYSSSHE